MSRRSFQITAAPACNRLSRPILPVDHLPRRCPDDLLQRAGAVHVAELAFPVFSLTSHCWERRAHFPRPWLAFRHLPFRNHSLGRSGGFSLIEIMVVLVLIGIMSAMILPEMAGTYEDMLLRSTARELVDVCQLASSRAITLGQPHLVRIDAKTGQYRLERPVRDREEGSGFVAVQDMPGSEGELDTRISIDVRESGDLARASTDSPAGAEEEGEETRSRSQGLAFYPDGTANRMEIHLRDRQGFGLILSIHPVTSRIRITELERP